MIRSNHLECKDGHGQVEKVKKRSMEEWEERLKRKTIRKESAVDRIIEMSEKKRNLSLNSLNSGYSSASPMNSPVTNKSSKCVKRRLNQFELNRPRSLDRIVNRSSGSSRKFKYYSKDEYMNADDEGSDVDAEVAAITKMLQTDGIGYSSKMQCLLLSSSND